MEQFHDYDNEIKELSDDCILLVDFYTTFCPMCKVLSKTLDEIKKEYSDIGIIKINVEESPEMADEFEIKSVPTLLITKNGVLLEIIIGNINKNQLEEKISVFLN